MTQILLITSVLCSSLAHLMLKLGADGLVAGAAPRAPLALFWAAASSPRLLSGIALHVLALGLWVAALARTQLSYAYPFIALGFVLVALLSRGILGESLSVMRSAGLAIIVIGLLTVAASK